MPEEIELRLTSDRNNYGAIAAAIARYCRLAAIAPLSNTVRIVIHGGPLLHPEQMRGVWQHILPRGAVEDALVAGVSVYPGHNGNNEAPAGAA
jgi:hypothetical protein